MTFAPLHVSTATSLADVKANSRPADAATKLKAQQRYLSSCPSPVRDKKPYHSVLTSRAAALAGLAAAEAATVVVPGPDTLWRRGLLRLYTRMYASLRLLSTSSTRTKDDSSSFCSDHRPVPTRTHKWLAGLQIRIDNHGEAATMTRSVSDTDSGLGLV